jgi:high-affinity nickel-transport protein
VKDTGFSVTVALLIGSVEPLGLLDAELKLSRDFWTPLENFNLNSVGFIVVGLFVVTRMAAITI